MYWQRALRRAYGRLFGRYDYSSHVIVLHDYKAIYFAVPKVANSSMKSAIWYLLPQEIREQTPDKAVKRSAFTTKSSREELFSKSIRILKHQAKKFPDYLGFAFVRNPWDRLVSCYSDKILSSAVLEDGRADRAHRAIHDRAQLPENMEFDAFVRRVVEIPDAKANRHFRSQYTFLTDRRGRLLPRFIGRYENLAEDFNRLQEMLGVSGLSLPTVRKSERQAFQSYYTEELRELVADRYKRDIELFEYRFDT